MSRASDQFSSVKTEGGLLPQDILARIQAGDPELSGTNADTYHLGQHERIGEAANQAWSRLVAYWHSFQGALAKEPEDAFATGLTRDRWLLPLFEILGYGRLPKGTAIEVDGKSYAVSHTWHHSPIHLLGCRVDLDTRQKGVAGAAMSSPHGLVQDFLNRSDDHLWGFVSNGYQLRVLRDHHSLTRHAYVEFDLQAIMDGEQYSEFLLLWLVCHQSRVEAEKPEECWLETWVNISREEGVRALDKLRDGVEKAIEAFGTGFLAHKANTRLKAALESGELDSQEYYREILRLVYRLIFLFVAEERDALLDPNATEEARERYRRYYATRRIRDLADRRRGGPHGDIWRGIALVMEKLDDGYPELGLPALGSMLWGEEACPWLMDAECANDHVLTAVRLLSHIQDGKTRYPVNWRNVGADELGSVYEGLLELHPRMNKEAGTFELDSTAGHERKTTGSYYTPTSLVDCLLDSALDPVLEEAVSKANPEQAILDLKVCDPACGSGHFLTAAARRIAKRLASVRSGDDEPGPRDVEKALRDVVSRCIYGVDLNPMAVELCKVSLWMEAIEPGKPLSFLDSHIQCGNALLGATPAVMSRGIPDDAFKPIEGDDKDVAKRLKKRNKDERGGQTTLFGLFVPETEVDHNSIAGQASIVEKSPDDSITAIRDKEQRWNRLSHSAEFQDAWFRADAWCAAFLWPKQPGDLEDAAITHDTWRRIEKDAGTAGQVTKDTVRKAAQQYRFFHWHLAFPQAFGSLVERPAKEDTTGWAGGFDVVLGNPPWERIKLQEKEWFATRSESVARAGTASARKKAIEGLKTHAPALWSEWQDALRSASGESHFVRATGRFPLCAVGDINTFALFAELNWAVTTQSGGRVGCIVPTGIVSDVTYRHYFDKLASSHEIVSVFDFENREKLFPGVDSRQNFSLLTLCRGNVIRSAEFAFYCRRVSDLEAEMRKFTLTADDIAAINPNSRTCPIFRTEKDAALAKRVYGQLPVILKEEDGDESPWGMRFHTLFHMTNDASLFRTSVELTAEGLTADGNAFADKNAADIWVPVYEGKMVGMYDHRFANIVFNESNPHRPQQPQINAIDEKSDPRFVAQPYLWASNKSAIERSPSEWGRDWFLTFKRVTAATNERTMIGCVTPHAAVSYTLYVVTIDPEHFHLMPSVAASLFAIVADYFVRQKTTQPSLPMGVVYESPLPPPAVYQSPAPWDQQVRICEWLKSRVLELSYTAWDLEPFARDMGYEQAPFEWDDDRRGWLRAEIDAALFHIYGLSFEDAIHVLDSFPVLQKNDERRFGTYRTKDNVMEIYLQLAQAIESGNKYRTILESPPRVPRKRDGGSLRVGE